MVQILRQQPFSSRIGEALGTGLGSGLQALAAQKIQQMQQQKAMQGLSALGIAPERAAGLSALPPEMQQVALKQLLQEPSQQAFAQALNTLLGGAPAESVQATQPGQPSIPAGINAQQAMQLAQLGLQKQQIASKESKNVREFSKPYQEKAEASRANIRDYDQLIKLAQSGKLRAGNTQQLLSKVGLEGFNRNINTQLADKLIARLAQNSRTAFGGTSRITNYLEQVFQRSLPTLWNTAEGIVTISKLNKLTDQANIIKDDIRKQVIRENRGAIPFDVDDIINDRARSQLDQLENEALTTVAGATPQKVMQSFEKLPSASEYPGKRMRFPDGSIRRSVEGKWVKE